MAGRGNATPCHVPHLSWFREARKFLSDFIPVRTLRLQFRYPSIHPSIFHIIRESVDRCPRCIPLCLLLLSPHTRIDISGLMKTQDPFPIDQQQFESRLGILHEQARVHTMPCWEAIYLHLARAALYASLALTSTFFLRPLWLRIPLQGLTLSSTSHSSFASNMRAPRFQTTDRPSSPVIDSSCNVILQRHTWPTQALDLPLCTLVFECRICFSRAFRRISFPTLNIYPTATAKES